jgi:hypothetical protein
VCQDTRVKSRTIITLNAYNCASVAVESQAVRRYAGAGGLYPLSVRLARELYMLVPDNARLLIACRLEKYLGEHAFYTDL